MTTSRNPRQLTIDTAIAAVHARRISTLVAGISWGLSGQAGPVITEDYVQVLGEARQLVAALELGIAAADPTPYPVLEDLPQFTSDDDPAIYEDIDAFAYNDDADHNSWVSACLAHS